MGKCEYEVKGAGQMTHTKKDFIKVCDEVLKKQDLNKVERVHSFSFWIDLKNYLEDSDCKQKEHIENFKKLFKDVEF